MRRFARHSQARSFRASLRVEALEGRRLLSMTTPASSQYSVPLSVGYPVGSPPQVETTGLYSSSEISTQTGPPASGPFSPAQIRHTYGVDQLSSLDGTGQTIAIVDAYLDPTVVSDLAAFDTRFSLPAANLTVATPESNEGTMVSDSGWDLEISLDVEWAHAIAPGAKILLVEAYSSNDSDLLNAVSYAVSQGANQVSMSWGGGEYSGESSLDSYFKAPGVTYLASSGDSGGQMLFPAISPYVTSVGGTTISIDSSGNRISETAWSSGGGGQSVYNAEPSFQKGFQSTGFRTTPDVAYDADPNSGVYVYDNGSWYGVGGTSAGSPQWAGLIALANEGLANAKLSPVGTGQPYGTNSVLYKLAGGTSYTNPNGDFLDITTGSNSHPAGTGYDEATGLGVPVAAQLIPDLIGPAPVPTVSDSGFEAAKVGAGSFAYNPSGSAWTFSNISYANGSGVASNNSAFTFGNPNAPQGSQVAFLQGTGTITQAVGGWSAGTYAISFDAAQRGNYGTSLENFELLVDGQVIGTFLPTGASYQVYTSSPFTVTAGTHTIEFLGLDSVGGDNTALLDAVSVAVATSSATPTVGDSGFEQANVGAGNFAYNPTGSAWTFSNISYANGSGVSGNGSGFTAGNPNAPQGSQVAFLQGKGTITQTVAGWSAGSYAISFEAAQRGDYGTSREDFELLIDGTVVGTFLPSTTSYQLYTSPSFAVTAGTHTIQFLGLDTVGGDNTALLDAVTVAAASSTPPPPPTPGDSGFEQANIGAGNFAYNPTGSAWTFSNISYANGSGVSGNGSGFTAGNPNAPQGSQVAFLQGKGTITQAVAGWTAGKYTISFDAAQRGDYGTSTEDFEILIDGAVVGTFLPSTTSYQLFTSASFTVTTGTHTIQFLGLDTVGGDNTALLDAVTIASA